MRRPFFHRPHDFHGFHGLQAHLVTFLTLATPFIFLFVVWWLVNEIVNWMWTVVPHPLSWGDWPLHR